jgi:cytochrome P450
MAVRMPPGTGVFQSLQVLRGLRRNPLEYLVELERTHGDICRFRIGPYVAFVLNNPDYIKHVLQTNHRNYTKSMLYRFIRPVVGDGLLRSEGELWRRQRRLIQPAFQPRQMAGFVETFGLETSRCLDRWLAAADAGQVLDMHAEMMALTFQIIGRAVCSADVSESTQAMFWGFETAMTETMYLLNTPIHIPLAVPTRRNRRYKRSIRVIKRIVNELVDQRYASAGTHGDVLDDLIAARDPDSGQGMGDAQLRDEVITLLVAGHETTTNALTWTLYLLARHPDVLAKLRRECQERLQGRIPGSADVASLSYTRMVVEESMRLYPPVWEIERRATGPDVIDGYEIPAGATVSISQYVMHRSPRFWAEPATFDPERFAPERQAERHRFVYFPFGAGPRVCIGNHFALAETVVVLAAFAQHLIPELATREPIEPLPLITLRPRHGLPMFLRRAG